MPVKTRSSTFAGHVTSSIT